MRHMHPIKNMKGKKEILIQKASTDYFFDVPTHSLGILAHNPHELKFQVLVPNEVMKPLTKKVKCQKQRETCNDR